MESGHYKIQDGDSLVFQVCLVRTDRSSLSHSGSGDRDVPNQNGNFVHPVLSGTTVGKGVHEVPVDPVDPVQNVDLLFALNTRRSKIIYMNSTMSSTRAHLHNS